MRHKKKVSDKKTVLLLFILVIVRLLCSVGGCIAFTIKILELQSEAATLKRLSQDCATLQSELEQKFLSNVASGMRILI